MPRVIVKLPTFEGKIVSHEPGMIGELRALIASQRVATLGTIGDDGGAFVSMVPFALEPVFGCLVIHVSELAAHTGNLLARPKISLLVMQAEVPGEPVHALPRVTLEGFATVLEPQSHAWQMCRAVYLQRFPEAAPMTQLGDFKFVAVAIKGARQVSGFAVARSINEEGVKRALVQAI